MWLVATLLTKHTSMVNVWSQISHRLKQLPGPQKAKGPYLSWYSTVAGECVMSPKHWCLTVCSRRLLMGVWPCFFCCDVRLTEEFLISVLLELLSEMLEFDLDESWCFVAGIPNNSLELFSTKSEAAKSPVTTWPILGPFQIGLEPGGLPSMGSHRVGYDWSKLTAAAG